MRPESRNLESELSPLPSCCALRRKPEAGNRKVIFRAESARRNPETAESDIPPGNYSFFRRNAALSTFRFPGSIEVLQSHIFNKFCVSLSPTFSGLIPSCAPKSLSGGALSSPHFPVRKSGKCSHFTFRLTHFPGCHFPGQTIDCFATFRRYSFRPDYRKLIRHAANNRALSFAAPAIISSTGSPWGVLMIFSSR